MSGTFGTRSDFITNVRQAATKQLELAAEFAALRAQWDRGMNNALIDAAGEGQGDFEGANEGLHRADITAVMTTEANLVTWLLAGNGTNLEKVRS